jgi:hypothetical protein
MNKLSDAIVNNQLFENAVCLGYFDQFYFPGIIFNPGNRIFR